MMNSKEWIKSLNFRITFIKNKITDLEDEYQHYTMVDKDKVKEILLKEEIDLYNQIKQDLDRLEKLEKEIKDGTLSDGYHTFNDLYYQRLILFATIVNQNKEYAWKSLKHEDGELCFGGNWFIVGIDTPNGSYTYHYETNYWSLFNCKELEVAKHWDGHTSKDVDRLLSLHHNAFDQLEKENQELKETLNKTRKMGLEIIEEKEQLSNELHKLNCYRNIELDEISKLKKAIKILKQYVAISKRRNEVNGNYDISCIYSFGSYKDIIQGDYELLKSVLEEE